MEDFNSKYTGEQVENLLDQVASGNAGGGGGGITVEADPIFSASPAASITEEDKEAWNNKVSYSAKDFHMVNADGFMTSEGDGFVFPNTPAAQAGHGVVLATLDDIPNEIPIETYLADFTMEALRDGMYNGTNVDCDMQALVAAMNANKIILVRESESSDYKGVYVLNGYAEDLLYFSIVDSYGDILRCEGTNYTGGYIDGRTLHLESWHDKQDNLVSGENIKTINGESIVGSGDMVVGKITYFSEEDTLELSPGVVWIRTRMVVNSVQITSFASNNKPLAEYAYYFSTGTIADGNAVKLILPDGVKYANKDVFDALESDTHYELSVVRSAGIVKAVLTAFK